MTQVSKVFDDNTDLSIDRFLLSEAQSEANAREQRRQPRLPRDGRIREARVGSSGWAPRSLPRPQALPRRNRPPAPRQARLPLPQAPSPPGPPFPRARSGPHHPLARPGRRLCCHAWAPPSPSARPRCQRGPRAQRPRRGSSCPPSPVSTCGDAEGGGGLPDPHHSPTQTTGRASPTARLGRSTGSR